MEQEDIELIENAVAAITKNYDLSREEVIDYMEAKWVKPLIESGETERQAWMVGIDKLLLYFLPPDDLNDVNEEVRNKILVPFHHRCKFTSHLISSFFMILEINFS